MSQASRLLNPRLRDIDSVDLFERANGFAPTEWQVPYLRETRNTILLKGRQIGASTCAGTIACRVAIHRPGSLSAIISPSQNQSKEVKLRAKTNLERLGYRLVLDSASVVSLENGSRIISLPGSSKSARGWSADILVIDEAAFIDPDTFTAVRATVAATHGRVIIQSTPAGPYGIFHDLFESTEDGWARYGPISSEDVPSVDQEFLAHEKANMTTDEYKQEYLGKFARPGAGLVDPARLAQLTDERSADADSVWSKVRKNLEEQR